MKIKKVDCTQFAGMRGKHYEFQDGLNLLIGNNETGKSTMADLIFQVLFKDPKVNMKTDKQFSEKYYLKKKGDTTTYPPIGSITFEGTDGEYTLSKEWAQTGSTVRMTCPDGTVLTDPDTINKKLKEQLIYQAGVYDQIAFASQKRDNNALGSILKAADDKSVAETRTDLKATLGKAAMETGGASIDKVQKGLDQKLKELGDHWDFDADLPVGGAKRGFTNPWVREVGEILGLYYKLEELKAKQKKTETAEQAVEDLNAKIIKAQNEKSALESKKDDFGKYMSLLGNRKLLLQRKEELENAIEEAKTAAGDWPQQILNKKAAKDLRRQMEEAAAKSLYEKVLAARENYLDAEKKLEKLTEVDTGDIKAAKDASKEMGTVLSKLTGMDIEAEIKNISGAVITVKNIRDDSVITATGEKYVIKEAVLITIPGVAEIRLIPKGVDVHVLKSDLDRIQNELQRILRKYGADSVDKLLELSEEYSNAKRDKEISESAYTAALDGKDWVEIRRDGMDAPDDTKDIAEVEVEIKKLCGARTPDGFIGTCDTKILDYENKYMTQEDLAKKIREKQKALESVEADFAKCAAIPEEYAAIEDPSAYADALSNRIGELHKLIEDELRGRLNTALGILGTESSEDYSDAVERAEKDFKEKKEEYSHWKHISEVFTKLKESSKGNPAEDIEKSFRKNLDILTGGTISLGELNGEFTADLSSNDHPLTMETISEGTRDTLSLAFRLAMLEHLFPDGGAVAVFDDPFTDMDPTRVKQACGLIENFAKKNQVIFITCDNKYETLMKSGNCISADA